ncbi:uracil-DNA glycosylase [Lacinutrix iliipiscaria]|uniref:Uracil-DNA glycosylase n=1 Tax=Lacinutrix iliipiscaria TaxID=1230532 RepID=A0ABW5WNT2_9FLAO
MQVKIDKSWEVHLQEEFKKPYFKLLTDFVKEEYKLHQCFPKGKDIFNAFNLCAFENTRVVIIGQDPYHGFNQANGMCFSVNNGVAFPPSLKNIFKELETDLGITYPNNGNLESWARQGVLLLNATLTVRAHQAGSHQNKGWETFTDHIIQLISQEKKDVVFMLWGGFAKKKVKLINSKKHHILTTGHPSPLSANRGYWFNNKHFSKTNFLLEQAGLQPVDWKV